MRPRLYPRQRLLRRRTVEQHQENRLLAVQAILGLVEDDRRGRFEHLGRHFFAFVRRQPTQTFIGLCGAETQGGKSIPVLRSNGKKEQWP